jgi:hypothetical protein
MAGDAPWTTSLSNVYGARSSTKTSTCMTMLPCRILKRAYTTTSRSTTTNVRIKAWAMKFLLTYTWEVSTHCIDHRLILGLRALTNSTASCILVADPKGKARGIGHPGPSISSFSFGACLWPTGLEYRRDDPVFDARTFTYFGPFVVQNMGVTSHINPYRWAANPKSIADHLPVVLK